MGLTQSIIKQVIFPAAVITSTIRKGKWYEFDDTAHATFEYKYRLDSLTSEVNLDSLSKERKKVDSDTTGQIEAVYKGGESKFTNSFKILFSRRKEHLM